MAAKKAKIQQRTVKVDPGLTWSGAYKQVSKKLKDKGVDFRGMNYNKKSGVAKIV
jgi:hypothetical protein